MTTHNQSNSGRASLKGARGEFLNDRAIDENFVVALKGVGFLFGFLRVKDVVDQFAPLVSGRLLGYRWHFQKNKKPVNPWLRRYKK